MTISELWCAYLNNNLDDLLISSDLNDLDLILRSLKFDESQLKRSIRESQKQFLSR